MDVSKKKVENSIERKIISHSIMSTHFLNSMIGLVNPAHFYASFSRKIWTWLEEYYSAYQKAPQSTIQEIFMAHRIKMTDDDEVELISMFLTSLSDQYQEPSNYDYEIKICKDWINMRSLYTLNEKITKALQHNDVVEAQNLVANYTKVEKTKESIVVLSDMRAPAIQHAFDQAQATIVTIPGAFGKVVGDIKRTDFLNFLSPAKMGKSFFLQDVGVHAMQQGRKVLELNYEMEETQRIRRFWTRITTSPTHTKDIRYPYFYKDRDIDQKWKIGYHEEQRAGVRLDEEYVESFWGQYKTYSNGGDYKLKCLRSKIDTVKDVRNRIINMELYDEWKPDVVILDHPILLRYSNRGEGWEQIGDLFAELRGLASELDIALITATHSTRAGYKASMLDETQTGKSIDILNHVTACVAVTTTKAEKERGFYRASQLVVREGTTYSDQCLIAQCLDISMPHIDSRFLSEIEDYKLPEGGQKDGDNH